MASSGRSGYHQDYIARIRYENNLPPPPGAPKLLNIPIEGLNYYTSAAFASRMARQQPLNVEADAELGMPIDLVGVPGIFDGDESSIQAPLAPPPIHPKDKPLLRPLSELGKPKFTTGAHSFLRRTEYISTDAKGRTDGLSSAPRGMPKSPVAKKPRRQSDAAREDPMNLLRHVIKGFDIANPEDVYRGKDDEHHLQGAKATPAEVDAWNNPRHPAKPELKLLESYPIKPDLESMPDPGFYMVTKFSGNPTAITSRHDTRVDVGLLNPIERGDDYDYEFYIPQEASDVQSIKRKFEIVEGDDGSDPGANAGSSGETFYKYCHHRTYEQGRRTDSVDHPYNEVALALHDPTVAPSVSGRLDMGAYYYPIGTKTQYKPKRSRNLANLGLQRAEDEAEVERADEIDLTLREPDSDERKKRRKHRDELALEQSTNGIAVAS